MVERSIREQTIGNIFSIFLKCGGRAKSARPLHFYINLKKS